MSEEDKKLPLDAALRHLAEQQRRSLTSHPTPQELAAYHAGELPPEAEAKILDHLAVCRECSDLLLELSGFADLKPPAGVPELTDAQVEEDWQKLRSRMKKDEREPAEVVPIQRAGPARKPERAYSPLLPIAASLLAVLGFSFAIYQSIQVGKLSKPRLSQVVTVGVVRSGPNEPAQISSQDATELIVDYPIDSPTYRVEIRDGAEVELSQTGQGPVTQIPIDIPPGSLDSGKSYQLYLYEGGHDEPLEDFEIEVK